MKIVLTFAALIASSAFLDAADRPNVIFIVADDLGYGELGCFGGKDIPTPQIDSIARQGVRFTNGYVTAPFCVASRAAMLTGRYQTRFGFEHNPIGTANADLVDDIQRRIFASMLAQLDDGVGRVLGRVRSEGLEERTLIVFLSDNGGPTRELTSSNRPLRGEKGALCLVSWRCGALAACRSATIRGEGAAAPTKVWSPA
ncbi:MAG: sulfatase-like hydrolase/transferase [Opitutaceae bacterium]